MCARHCLSREFRVDLIAASGKPIGRCFGAIAHEQVLLFAYLLEAMMEPLVAPRCVDYLACLVLCVSMESAGAQARGAGGAASTP